MQSSIRFATANDAELLPAIERSAAQIFRAVTDLAWIADGDVMSVAQHRVFISKSTCWVAVDADDQPLGFLCAERQDQDLHIHELSVRQGCQGHGHGRRLILAAVNWARARKLRAVTLTTFQDVPWNAPFYARLGFKVLENDRLGKRLHRMLSLERDSGLPGNLRCAMALPLVHA